VKVDFDAVLVDLDGEPLTSVRLGWRQVAAYAAEAARNGKGVDEIVAEIDKAQGEDLTLGDVSIEALLNTKSASTASGKEKLRRFALAKQIKAGGKQNLSTKKDCSFLDDCLAEYLTNPMAYGSANGMLFPGDPIDDDEDEPAKDG